MEDLKSKNPPPPPPKSAGPRRRPSAAPDPFVVDRLPLSELIPSVDVEDREEVQSEIRKKGAEHRPVCI